MGTRPSIDHLAIVHMIDDDPGEATVAVEAKDSCKHENRFEPSQDTMEEESSKKSIVISTNGDESLRKIEGFVSPNSVGNEISGGFISTTNKCPHGNHVDFNLTNDIDDFKPFQHTVGFVSSQGDVTIESCGPSGPQLHPMGSKRQRKPNMLHQISHEDDHYCLNESLVSGFE